MHDPIDEPMRSKKKGNTKVFFSGNNRDTLHTNTHAHMCVHTKL